MKRSGFSLAELLVTLFLLSLVIAVAADLMHRSRQVSRFYRQRDALQSAAFALQLLAQQSCAAVEITQPTLGGSSVNFIFQRIRNDISTRLPTTLGSNPAPIPVAPPVWQPTAAAFRETITITRNGQGELTWTSSTGSLRTLAEQLTAFEVRSQGRRLEFRATLLIRGQSLVANVFQMIEPGVTW